MKSKTKNLVFIVFLSVLSGIAIPVGVIISVAVMALLKEVIP